MEHQTFNYRKGFLPYAVAAAVLSLCGGLTAAVPSNIVADWSLKETSVTWFAMAYSLGTATLAPVMGKLADLMGHRKVLLYSLLLFAAAPLAAALIPVGYLVPILALRFLAGVGGSAVAPVVMSYIMSNFPQSQLGKGFTLYMVISCGMVIFGPALGGVILTRSGWRVVLILCAVLAAIAWGICFLMVKSPERKGNTSGCFDYTGAILVVLFFSMVLAIPTFGQNNGWFALPTLICIGIGAASLALLFVVERRAENPILNGRFMARKQFVLPVVALFLSQGLLQSSMTNIITFSIVTTGDRTLSGIATSIMYVGMALGTILIGPMADKREPRTVAAAALSSVAAGAAIQLLFVENTGLLLMGASMFLIGLGLGGNGTIFLKVVLSGLSRELAGSGAGTYNVFRDMSAPFGVAIFVPLFSVGLANGTAAQIAAGIEEAQARSSAAVDALHATALVQVICVIAGIAVCLFLPKIHPKRTGE